MRGGRAFGPDEKFLVVPANVWGLFVFSEVPVVFSEALVGGLRGASLGENGRKCHFLVSEAFQNMLGRASLMDMGMYPDQVRGSVWRR